MNYSFLIQNDITWTVVNYRGGKYFLKGVFARAEAFRQAAQMAVEHGL